ncbi:ribosomal protein S5 domain 2-like protein [Zopfia rhizophila CBS 207.26]|uniref:Ribosomal protein S5 domain 2-like protein n=1 Tax=Zopfia rhizophila CBS 207.26 TaxID=1314779 RepID=A0A6A6E3B3_9PEZI|nr:ribosomal protein S5 domain 2-like protein [Zopfia rhizophila CBS 207.26]
MSLKRARSPSPPPSPLEIFHSDSIEDQKSAFIAVFSGTLSVRALQGLPEFKSATHRITAWRKPSRQKSLMPQTKVLYDVGHDDDGEKWAGKKLEHVLVDQEVEGVVVVARWYGGTLLGPIRFTHIENCAREAIWKWRVADAEAKKEEAHKNQKLEENAARAARAELEETLRERDQSIFVLRGLLADKTAALNQSEPAPPTPQKKPPDYSKMSTELLKKMDKARDATIAFILKEIDKVEEQVKLLEDFNDSTQDSRKDREAKEETNEPASSQTIKKDASPGAKNGRG